MSETLPKYVPVIVDYPENRWSEFILFDVPTYTRHVVTETAVYDELRDLETNEVVGFRWPTPKAPN